MPPRRAQTPRRSAFAKAHPFVQYILSSLYDYTWPAIYAAMIHNLIFCKSEHSWRRRTAWEWAVVVWIAKPTFLVAELVYGLRAVRGAGQDEHEGVREVGFDAEAAV